MLLLGLVGWWMLGGYLIICASLAIHITNAERKGYEAWKYVAEHDSTVGADLIQTKSGIANVLLGLLVWPIGWVRFLISIPDRYDAYELKF